MGFLLLVCHFYVIGSFLLHVKAQNQVILLPSLCNTISLPSPGEIIRAHAGVDAGMSFYPTPVNSCRYVLLAADMSQRIIFAVGTGREEVNVIMHDGGCNASALEIYDSDGTSLLGMLCDGVIERGMEFVSSADRLTLNFRTEGGNSSIVNFTAYFTSFSDDANCGDDPRFFRCNNGRCIDPVWRCDVNLIDNCGDISDNSRGPPGNCSSEPNPTTATTISEEPSLAPTSGEIPSESNIPLIVGITVGSLLLIYTLYWLLWRPGYLVWRCSCWRHWCYKTKPHIDGGNHLKNPAGSSKSGENLTQSKVPSMSSEVNKSTYSKFDSKLNGLQNFPNPGGLIREQHIFF